jgi:hypothetical protein
MAVCLFTWLICAGNANGQAASANGRGDKFYDDPRVVQWSADLLAGKRELVLRAVEAGLKSSSRHPFAPHIWLKLQFYLTEKEPALADVTDRKLRDALGALPDIQKPTTSS